MSKKKKQVVLTPEEQRAAEIAEKKKELLLAAIHADDPEQKKHKIFRPIVIVIAVICAVLIFFLATFCFVGNTWFTKVNLEDDRFDSSTYSEEQKQAAADAVIDFFHKEFNGSVLYELDYSEKWSEEREALCFTGKFYAIFSNNDVVDDTSMVKGSKWHWDVQPSDDGGYEVASYGLLKDIVTVGEDETEAAEE